MAEKPEAEYSSTLMRGLAVLKCFSQSSEALTASDIARMTGIPQPTVWRFCKALQSGGYLVVDRLGTRFRPGIAVLNLGFSAIGRYGLAELARPYLMQLAIDFKAVSGVAVPDDGSVRYIQRHQAPDAAMTYNIKVGWTLPFLKTSSGWAFLAIMSETEREKTIDALKEKDTDTWAIVERPFRKALEAFPRTGVMVTVDILYPGLTSVALPLVNADTNSQYAIYCTGMTSMLSRKVIDDKLVPRLKSVSQTLRPALASEEYFR